MIKFYARNQFVLVSDEDKDLIKKCIWEVNYDGHVAHCKAGFKKHIYLHKMIAGRINLNGRITFKDGNKLNCQRENLEICEKAKNLH